MAKAGCRNDLPKDTGFRSTKYSKKTLELKHMHQEETSTTAQILLIVSKI